MKTVLLILIIVIVLFGIRYVFSVRNIPAGYDVIDMGQYELVLGTDAKQIFYRYRVSKMHGLSLDGAEKRIAEGGTYIDGLCNYHPRDKNLSLSPDPFLFLNIGSLQNNYSGHKVYTCVMHECMHMAGIKYNGCWDSHEEEMITWAEAEANRIIELLKKKKYI